MTATISHLEARTARERYVRVMRSIDALQLYGMTAADLHEIGNLRACDTSSGTPDNVYAAYATRAGLFYRKIYAIQHGPAGFDTASIRNWLIAVAGAQVYELTDAQALEKYHALRAVYGPLVTKQWDFKQGDL
jgi:hypothetical protein